MNIHGFRSVSLAAGDSTGGIWTRRFMAAFGRTCFAAMLIAAVGAGGDATAQDIFTVGNLVVSLVGDGVTPITTGTVAMPVTLQEYTTAGVATTGSVTLPTTNTVNGWAFAGQNSSTSFGFLKRSVDGRYLTIAGANIPAGTTGSVFSSGAQPNRVVAVVNSSGYANTWTRFNAAGTTPRSAITTNGTDIWWSGDAGSGGTGGIRYVTLGSATSGVPLASGDGTSSTTAGQPAPVPLNSRVLNIFNNQLYGSAATAVGPNGANNISFRGVFNVGTGLPTTANQLGSLIVGSGTTNQGLQDSTYDFYFADASTLYVADDDSSAPATGGVTKWKLTGSTWNKTWLATPASTQGVRALAGVTDPISGNVELYGITAVASGQNALVKLTDTLSGTVAPTWSAALATAPTNYVFRGVAFAPVPEPAAVGIGLAGFATLLVAQRLRRRRVG